MHPNGDRYGFGVALIEIHTFKLAAGVDDAQFLEADYRVQTEVIPTHRGFARRTTARGEDQEWLVLTLWASVADADASARQAEDHEVAKVFKQLIDPSTVAVRRFETLD